MTREIRRDILAALFLFAVALGVWILTWDLPRGTMRKLGPGAMPLLLASLLSVCGCIILLQAIIASRSGDNSAPASDHSMISWRIIGNAVLVVGSIVLFAHGVNIFGLALTAFAVVAITGQSSPELSWKQAILSAAGFSIFAVLLFKVGLNLTMPVLPW